MKRRRFTDQEKIDIVNKYQTQNYNCASLAREYSSSGSAIRYILVRRGVKIRGNASIRRQYTLNEHYFDIIDTQEKAYWLGFLYADGYNNEKGCVIKLCLQENDKEILEKFNIAINSNRPLEYKNRQNEKDGRTRKNQFILSISSKYMSQQLAKLGCFQCKSLTLKFPTEEQVPSHLIRHFIRGYFDGDGSITFNPKIQRITCNITSTLDMCENIQNIISNIFPYKGYLYRKQESITKNNTTRALIICGNSFALQFLNWIYKDAEIYLDRKWRKTIECVELVRISKPKAIIHWTL